MYRDLVVISTLAMVIGLDQLTKFLVRDNMTLGQSVPTEGFFRITHYANSGTIFGLFQSATVILTVVSVAAIVFLVWFYRSQTAPSTAMRFAIGLLLGGAVGNLIDRLAMGKVTDFIDVGRWPVFNITDASITVGIVMLIVFTSLTPEKHTPTERQSGANPGSNADGPTVGEPVDRSI